MAFRTTLLIAAVLCFSTGTLDVLAAGKGANNTDCASQAAGMNDTEREAFMDACLSRSKSATPAQTSAPAPAEQGNKSACQTEAQSRGLKGNERKAFLTDCLSNSGGH
ncbi:PsiF family protein [Dokdonella sp.]|uniref:PsiF family protein n=1 Tax=Dokdonella sp. TaxID=2291710 RepID=UPI003C3EB79F